MRVDLTWKKVINTSVLTKKSTDFYEYKLNKTLKMPPQNISKKLTLFLTLLLLISATTTTKAQTQNKRLLIKSGSGKFSLKNTEPILIPFDLSMYQKGHINYIVKMAGGDGISNSGGRCEAAIGLARAAEYPKIINPDYLPVGAARVGDLGAELIKPENFILVLIPLCYNDPLRVGEYNYEIYLEKYEDLTCPPRTAETNPAEPVYNNKIQDKNYNDRSDNGKTFDIAPAGTKFGEGNDDPLFVNGIGMKLSEAEYTGFEIQKIINSPVRLLYNNSSLDGAVTLAINKYQKEKPPTPFLQQLFVNPLVSEVLKFQDFVADEKTARWAKANVLQNPPAAQSLAQEILNRAAGKRVNLIVHSQGAAIAAEALRMLHQCLGEKSAATLKNVRILSIGGAASNADFPPNVSVSSLYHKTDGIALGFGENRRNFTTDSLKYLVDTTQHSNYFNYKTDDGALFQGDPKVREWLLKWVKGTNFPSQEIEDYKALEVKPK